MDFDFLTELDPTVLGVSEVIEGARRPWSEQLKVIIAAWLRENDLEDKYQDLIKVHFSPIVEGFADWIDYDGSSHCIQITNGVAFKSVISSEGRDLYLGCDGRLIHWDMVSDALVAKWVARNSQVFVMDYHSGRLAASGEGPIIHIWDGFSHILLQCLIGHTKNVRSLRFFKDGRTIISGSEDNTIRIWSVETGECLKNISTGSVISLFTKLIRNESSVLIGFNGIHEWSVERGVSVRSIPGVFANGGMQMANDATINADGSKIAISYFYGPTVVYTCPELDTLHTIVDIKNVACFHPLNPDVLAVSDHRTHCIEFWDISDPGSKYCAGMTVHPSGRAASLSFTPNGQRLILIHRDTVYLLVIPDLLKKSDVDSDRVIDTTVPFQHQIDMLEK